MGSRSWVKTIPEDVIVWVEYRVSRTYRKVRVECLTGAVFKTKLAGVEDQFGKNRINIHELDSDAVGPAVRQYLSLEQSVNGKHKLSCGLYDRPTKRDHVRRQGYIRDADDNEVFCARLPELDDPVANVCYSVRRADTCAEIVRPNPNNIQIVDEGSSASASQVGRDLSRPSLLIRHSFNTADIKL